jgi:hypothetical protein
MEHNVEYCADPIDGELVFVADNTSNDTVEDQGIKLLECQGDCDQDWDCDVSNRTSAIQFVVMHIANDFSFSSLISVGFGMHGEIGRRAYPPMFWNTYD